ncbi:MAG: sigma-54 dependent transcriptional regulator [Bacteroidales bacterium]
MILIIDDDKAVRASLSILLQHNGFVSAEAANPEEAYRELERKEIDLIILDLNFSVETTGKEGLEALRKIKSKYPEIPVILITGWGHMSLAIDGMKAGAHDFINKPWDNKYLVDSICSVLRSNEIKVKSTERKSLDKKYNFDMIIGEDKKLLSVLQTIGRVSDTDAPLLILGESGTGKELVAEAIHQNSQRKKKPFVKVNLGGISSSLFESEMFGHKKGAFTDAYSDRTGRFELAADGTIFLDEIGELDLSCQVKLLRVLQDKKYEILGSSVSKSMDARIICATNKNLKDLVEQGKFREDLFYRINLVTVYLPPLRERKEDLPLLINYFMNNLRKLYQRPYLSITEEAMDWLKIQSWKGNIRELKNLVESTVLVNEKDTLSLQAFKKQAQSFSSPKASDISFIGEGMTLEEVEINLIKRAMLLYNNKITKAAGILGLSRNALYRRLEKYHIPYED